MTLTKKLYQQWQRYANDERFEALPDSDRLLMQKFFLSSHWLANWLLQDTDWPAFLQFIQADVDSARELNQTALSWSTAAEQQVMRDLRVWRNRHIARLIARDIRQLNTVRETALAVSNMADAAIDNALEWSTAFWTEKNGSPANCPLTGKPSGLVVIAMGKHGAQELNLSSDIDLIFSYPKSGETSQGRSHEEFFTRVGRKLIHVLDARTSDGFVFRVDMRLRPWGQSGALVSSFAALQNYYLQQGRFWERFAMVKARSVTGSPEVQQELTNILQPFVYRRYVDFQAVGALRDLKTKIQTEVRRQNLDRNIKLGQGGIREVEFIAQVFQLIRGGQDEILQQRGTWPVLESLAELELLPAKVVDELIAAYDFLRDLEHRIQAIRDEQTQTLPIDEVDLDRLALSAGFDSSEALLSVLEKHRGLVQLHFTNLISEAQEQQDDEKLAPYAAAWNGDDTLHDSLAEVIRLFQHQPAVERLKGVAKDNLDQFIPILWQELSLVVDGPATFDAIRPILDAILRRSSYFTLMSENPQAVKELVKLAPVSSWIVEYLEKKPFLLDELIDKDSLYKLPNRAELTDELHQLLLRVPEDDLERQMEVLRHFRHGRVLRAAACEVSAQLPLMKISDYLAWVAEVVVEQSLALVWRQMINRHGRPSKLGGDWCDSDFGVIAYGKMGGSELSYESDLDLVFLHNASPQGITEGPKEIENVVFMARLGQKLIHILSSVTPSGMLYEVDTRLRPSGKSGLLVSSLSAFEKYQQEKAWTWEHQALVRARFIAGDPRIKLEFNRLRGEIICRARDNDQLKNEVIEMRQKMVDHLSSDADKKHEAPVFNIKHDNGGIVDLEFLVQYCILANASEHPLLAKWSDNVRSIESLASVGVITSEEKDVWLRAYLALRQQVHHSILSGGNNTIPISEMDSEFADIKSSIVRAWQLWMVAR